MRMLSDKDLKAIAAEAGVAVVRITRSPNSGHAKVRCEHHGYHFYVLVSAHPNNERDLRWRMNAVSDFRKAKKAVEYQDPVLMKKYLGLRSATSFTTPKAKCEPGVATTPSKSTSGKRMR